MKSSKLYLLGMLILPWLTFPLLGRNTIKRFLPATIFITVITKIVYYVGVKSNWWRFYHKLAPLNREDPLIFGPYMASAFWMLKKTYGNFGLYLVSNFILHVLFIKIGLKYLQKLRIFTLVRLKQFRYWQYHFIRALMLYAFQFLKEKYFDKKYGM